MSSEMDFVLWDRCPVYSSFFGAMGCAAAIIFTTFGAAYGTAKSSGAIFSCGVLRPERLMQNTICAIMAQILSIYGLVVAVIISGRLDQEGMALHTGFLLFGAGLAVGMCGLAAGFAIGIIGDAGVRASTQQPRLYVGMILILIFSEVLGLYGTIIAIMMTSKAVDPCRVGAD
ncbi:V-type proton ATPase 16 kDa proteolipid subunit [Colletotrichum sidae]|uniref:V-type proton ATPase proteolipid subunit n=4 Tax=Colletotrichum orbiculare species complex TaxID=2707354 RepID=N4UYZ7_COLOR|nr:V-type proton ATPase 16 kDa proteolipid subunit [Colletotrichum orbiculare MAFF 240422]TDZ37237.1 V-type proton ATPase 16 kDa proteolipid subunit [Colletotrichum spinosum]TDZ71856.1 V-type proton ATPase 16 kDa proteolipid subunit [Colletotrichum trifolii]TDZ87548.1 V-type proton ATPase 16 kDa proteolipid subunit [Colletotrichum sidae]